LTRAAKRPILGGVSIVNDKARPEDLERVRAIAGDVFADYGDYAALLSRFFAARGVSTFVARHGAEVVGFIMLGFLPWSGGREDGSPWIGDLLSIAVAPGRQGRGVGRQLLQQAFALVEEMADWRDIREVQLTCAAGNERALEFFRRQGFVVSDPDHGRYSSGQPAVRMSRPYP